jgi:hypothetical protein
MTCYYDYGEKYPTKEELIHKLTRSVHRSKERTKEDAQSRDRQREEEKRIIPHREEIEEICEKLQNLYRDDTSKGPGRNTEKDKIQKVSKDLEKRTSTRNIKKT